MFVTDVTKKGISFEIAHVIMEGTRATPEREPLSMHHEEGQTFQVRSRCDVDSLMCSDKDTVQAGKETLQDLMVEGI